MPLVKHSPAPPPAPADPSVRLTDAEASVRRQSARLLAARLPETATILCAHLVGETSLSVRSIIFTELMAHPSTGVVEGLLPFLRSEDANLRNGAIEALQEMPGQVAPYVERLLADPDSDVRIFATVLLSMLPHPSAPSWLRQVVAEDPHVNVCAEAVNGLIEVGTAADIPLLRQMAVRFATVPFIQFAVDAAVRRLDAC